MLWLDEQEVERLLDPLSLIAAVEAAFADLNAHRFIEPPESRLSGLASGESYVTTFPSADLASGLASVKVLAGRPLNALDDRPEIDAVVCVVEQHTATIQAIVSARYLTAARTAATTIVALKAMLPAGWRGPIAILGTGAQGAAHARFASAAGLGDPILLVSARANETKANALRDRLEADDVRGTRVATLAEAARCPVLITATLAERHFALDSGLRERLIACIGPFLPARHEIDPMLVRAATRIVSDRPERLAKQWHDTAIASALRAPRLIGLADIAGRNLPCKGLDLFFSDGRAIEDNVAARLVLEAARHQNIGQRLR